MKKQLLSLAAIACVATAAQSEEVALDQITVTAAERTTLEMDATPATVKVITRDAIEQARVTTLQDALSRLANITMVSYGGAGQNVSFLLRGFDAKRVLVLIDGQRYNDVTGLSGAQFQLIRLDDVEQIEIVKGAQSGVWGADASAGVINIVTKRAKTGFHADAGVSVGSYDTKEGHLTLSYATDRFDVAAGFSAQTTDGFSAAEPVKSSPDYGKRGDELDWEQDGYINKTYHAKAGVNLTDNDRLEASARYIDAYVEYDAGAGTDAPNGLFTVNNLDNRFYSASYLHQDDVNDLSLQYSLSMFKRDQWGGYDGEVSEVSLQDRIDYAEEDFILFGATYQQYAQSTSAGSDLDEDYSATAGYVTNYNIFTPFSFGTTIVTESVRFDQYDSFDNTFTGKVGIRQNFRSYYVSLNGGTGYNVPTLYQLHDFWSGNPDLTPESTTSFDLTVGNESITATLFYNEITDLIDYDFGTWAFANFEGISIIKGIELGYNARYFDALRVSANYTYLEAKNSDGELLASRPDHQVDASLYYDMSTKLSIGVNGQYIGTRYDQVDKQGAQTGRYTVINGVANYAVTSTMTLYGKIDNITDRYYQVRDGYATAGRSYYFGVNASY